MTEAEAERAARRAFGDVTAPQGARPRRPHARRLENVVRDVRHMGRGLRKSPGFTLAVVLTLALGIGANTAIFSVVDQLLLRPLPYPGGDRLVMVYETFPASSARRSTSTRCRRPTGSTGSAKAGRSSRWRCGERPPTRSPASASPMRIDAQLVSAEFFPLLGVQPLLGRRDAEDDDRPEAPRVVILSHALWQRRFGGDRGTSAASCRSTTADRRSSA